MNPLANTNTMILDNLALEDSFLEYEFTAIIALNV